MNLTRIFFAILLLSLPLFIHAQVQDNFNDGDFTNNPFWSGEGTKFEVNTAQQLHLNAPAITDTAYLITTNTFFGNTEWYMWVKMDFAPSSSNMLKIYLSSDNANLKLPLNGYFLKLGVDGSADAIDLYKQTGTNETLIAAGIAGHVSLNSNVIGIKVSKTAAGVWNVYSDITGGTNFTLESNCTDNSFTSTSSFGFLCKYTSTRSTLFYFDDVYIGAPVVDVTPPSLVSATATDANHVDVLFSETVEQNSAELPSNYFADNGLNVPTTANRDLTNQKLVHLQFVSSFTNGTNYNLSVSNVKDLSNNILTLATIPFSYYTPQVNDIQINEIMADPTPVVGLPDQEFVELYNNSSYAINLANWTITDGSSIGNLSSYNLQPDSFLILCSTGNVSLFSAYGNVLGVPSFPGLNNDGDNLSLADANGNIISTASYDLSWYHNSNKQDGGWTLEKIDHQNPCGGSNNWSASINNSGGTPGHINSVNGTNPDVTGPSLIRATVLAADTVELFFDEPLDQNNPLIITNYNISNSIGNPAQAIWGNTTHDAVILILSAALSSNLVYQITVTGITDCIGNFIVTNNALFAIPQPITKGDVLINEILFNPYSGGYDFLEIYNNSQKIIDLSDLRIASADDVDSITTISDITTQSILFFPGEYVALTENKNNILQTYFTPNMNGVIEISNLPSFNDDKGTAVLLLNDGTRADELKYNASWHFALLDDVNGVSLERIRFSGLTQDSLNWHSAAATAGYATPAYKNSQATDASVSENEITLTPEVFSPNNDGYNDVLSINYTFDQPGYTANIQLYDAEGRLTKNLVANELLSQTGFFTWDGIDDRNEKARTGIYIVYVQIFKLDGTVKTIKATCVLGGIKQ